MSWQSWVDNLLAYEPVNTAAILGLDGSVWAKSPNYAASDAEVRALLAGLNAASAADFSAFHFQEKRFMTLRLQEGEVDGKSSSSCFSAVRSSQCVVVGAYIDTGAGTLTGSSQKVNLAVSKVKDALGKVGY